MDGAAVSRYREVAAVLQQALLRPAYLLCGDWAGAEDLVQETLVRLYLAWPRVDRDVADVRAYARAVLVREFLGRARRRSRRVEVLYARPPEVAAGYLGDTATDAVERDAVRRVLAGLAPRQRAVVVLRFFEDLDVAETARLLGISPGTVKSQTHDALAALRTRLAVTMEDHRDQ